MKAKVKDRHRYSPKRLRARLDLQHLHEQKLYSEIQDLQDRINRLCVVEVEEDRKDAIRVFRVTYKCATHTLREHKLEGAEFLIRSFIHQVYENLHLPHNSHLAWKKT